MGGGDDAAIEGAKILLLLLAGIIGWLVSRAPPSGQEGFMDYAVIAGVLMLGGVFGLTGIVVYGIYRIWHG